MHPITPNYVSQTEHGPYKAVDYSAYLDKARKTFNPWIHAPSDGKITLVQREVLDDCGRKLWHQGTIGRTGVCHIDEFYVKQGQDVKAGQLLAKMGFTGKTVPKGEAGRHAHQVLQLSNGEYVYPPSKITEPFGSGGADMIDFNEGDADNLYQSMYGKKPTAKEKKDFVEWAKNNKQQFLYETVIRRFNDLNRKVKDLSDDRSIAEARDRMLKDIAKALKLDFKVIEQPQVDQIIGSLKSGGKATPKQLAAEKAIDAFKEALK